jgi:hypothetical protein
MAATLDFASSARAASASDNFINRSLFSPIAISSQSDKAKDENCLGERLSGKWAGWTRPFAWVGTALLALGFDDILGSA